MRLICSGCLFLPQRTEDKLRGLSVYNKCTCRQKWPFWLAMKSHYHECYRRFRFTEVFNLTNLCKAVGNLTQPSIQCIDKWLLWNRWGGINAAAFCQAAHHTNASESVENVVCWMQLAAEGWPEQAATTSTMAGEQQWLDTFVLKQQWIKNNKGRETKRKNKTARLF